MKLAVEALEDRTLLTAAFAQAVAVDSMDGKIVAAGYSFQGATGNDFAVARYNPNGSLDTSFGVGGEVTIDFGNSDDRATGVAVMADGSVVVAGTSGFSDQYGAGDRFAVARLTNTGQFDTSFAVNGKQTIDFGDRFDFATGVAVQANGSVVVVGEKLTTVYVQSGTSFNPTNIFVFAMARLTSAGELDTSFNGSGEQTIDFTGGGTIRFSPTAGCSATSVALQSDGKIVVAGYTDGGAFTHFDFAVARLTTTGQLDTSFNGNGEQTIDYSRLGNFATGVAVQSDGKIVVAGTTNPGFPAPTLITVIRLSSTGQLDTFFGDGGGKTFGSGGFDSASGVALQSDGSVVVAGSTANNGSLSEFLVAKLTSTGQLDTSFFGGTGMTAINFGSNAHASGVAVTPDGKIVVAGDSSGNFALAQLTNTGQLDTPFGNYGIVTTDFLAPGSAGGPYTVTYGNSLTLNASFPAPDQALTYSWTINGNANAASGVQPTLSWADLANLGVVPGQNYAVNVTVDYGHGQVVTSADTTLTANKADAAITVISFSGTYDGQAHGIISGSATGVEATPANLSSLLHLGTQTFTDAPGGTATWTFDGNADYNSASGTAAIIITPKALTVDATTQGTLNIAKAGTISFALQITAGLIASNNNVAALFNGAVFTIAVDGTSYSLTSTATVASDGTINVSMKMTQGLQDALLTALSEGKTVDFSLSALSNGGDYSVAADAISRLISQGKLKYAVV